MTGLRTYGDPCGIARALDVVGERWALLIVRELLLGPKRFTDLRASLGASPNVVSQRLGELEQAGVVQRRSSGGATYELSDWGRELHPILLQLGRWGARAQHRPSGELGLDALMLALESTFVPDRAGALSAVIELRIGEERFALTVDQGAFAVTRGGSRRANAVVETDTATFRALAFGERKLPDEAVEIRGEGALVRSLLRCFARP